MTTKTVARWKRSTDPHTPGFLLRRGGRQVGRVLYVDLTRNYSCFVQPEGGPERWLGCAPTPGAAKTKVTDALG